MPDHLTRVFAGVWPAHVAADAPPLLGACAVVGRRVLVPAAGARGPASHHARGVTRGVTSDSAREVPLGAQSRSPWVDKLFETLILISVKIFSPKENDTKNIMQMVTTAFILLEFCDCAFV